MNSPLSLEKDKLYYMASFYFAFVANGVLLVLFKHHIVSSSVGCRLITFIYNHFTFCHHMCMWFNLLLTSDQGGFQRLKTRFVAMSWQEEVADMRKGLVDA